MNKTALGSSFSFCERTTTDFFTLYLSVESLLPIVRSCFTENARLVYIAANHSVRNMDGVETRIPGWGNTSGLEYLSPFRRSETLYFGAMVEALVTTLGYQRGISVRGAPYDFRTMPYGVDEYLNSLSSLIEETYAANGNRSVVLIGHSLGGNLLHVFLARRSAAWKQQYVRSVISLGAPFGGAVKTLLLQTCGDNFGVVIEPRSAMRTLERTFASIAALMPRTAYWNESEPLVVLQKHAPNATDKQYSTNDYEQLFQDLNQTDVFAMYNDTRPFLDLQQAPEVEWHCVHGTDVATPEKLIWGASQRFPDDYPSVVNGDGDGTVNTRSLRGCLRFRALQNQTVHHVTYGGVDHLHMLRNQDVIAYVVDFLQRANRHKEHEDPSPFVRSAAASALKYAPADHKQDLMQSVDEHL